MIKVLDTVEVHILANFIQECATDPGIDRDIYLHCDRKAGSSTLAY